MLVAEIVRSACKALSEVLWLKTPEVLEPSNSFLFVSFTALA